MRKDLKARLDALPPFGSQATALMTCEKETLDWFIRKVEKAKDEERLLALLRPLLDAEGNDRASREKKARALLAECGGTAAGVRIFASEVRLCYQLMAKKLDLPLDQFEKELEREKKKRADNPLFKVFFPFIENVRRAQARADVRRALLSAALAVQVDGRHALKEHPDPVVGGPFEYVAFEGGFELRSKLKGRDGKPVALTVGQRGK